MAREESERNDAIWRAYVTGRTEINIAREHGISQQRVSQIIKTYRDALPRETTLERALRELDFLDHVRAEAMAVAALPGTPVTAGKDGDIVRDPTTRTPEDPEGAIVRDYGGRLSALSLAVQTSAHTRKLLGLDQPTRIAHEGGVRHEVVGIDPEELV